MIKYKENWEDTQKRMDAFWAKDYIDRCCLSIRLYNQAKEPLVLPKADYSAEEGRTDADYLFRVAEHGIKSTVYLAEALPVVFPDFGVAAHAMYFGAKPDYTSGTVWFDPVIDEPDISRLVYDAGAADKHARVIGELAGRAEGLFMVAGTDNCGIIDALVNLRGNDALLLDMIDAPEFVEAARDKITEVWKQTQRRFYEISKASNGGGSSHAWMQTWARGMHGQLQCDFCVMISPEHFERFIMPELEATTGFYDNSTYHFDGQEQIRHLNMLLSLKNLDNIQWTPVAGQPRTSNFIHVLKKIQAAGKGLVLVPELDEVPVLLRELSHKGLMICLGGVRDIGEARDIIALAEKEAK